MQLMREGHSVYSDCCCATVVSIFEKAGHIYFPVGKIAEQQSVRVYFWTVFWVPN